MDIINELPVEDKKMICNYIKSLEYSQGGQVFVCDNCGIFGDGYGYYHCYTCKSWYCIDCINIKCTYCDIFFCLKCQNYKVCSSWDKICRDVNMKTCQECNELFCNSEVCGEFANSICHQCWERNGNRNIKKATNLIK